MEMTQAMGPELVVDGRAADRIFIRDLVLPARVGIFDHERGRTQSVRFAVIVDVLPPTEEPGRIEDTLSYDLISDAVREIVAAGHVDLVETLAERIAARVLEHPLALQATVRVEKLEIIAGGAVGVEIARRPAAPRR